MPRNNLAPAISLGKPTFAILLMIGFTHLSNDLCQSIIPAIYPMIKQSFHLNFSQIGSITLTFQLTASVLQPFFGIYNDKRKQPFAIIFAMVFSFIGLMLLAFSSSFLQLFISVVFIGIGSSIYHPESSRLLEMASRSRKGTAQSIFQVGGNLGSSIGPLIAAFIIAPFGQSAIIWLGALILLSIFFLIKLVIWYVGQIDDQQSNGALMAKNTFFHPQRWQVTLTICLLLLLVFSKYFYLASMTNYYTFFLINKFHISVKESQIYLFAFIFSFAPGTLIGGLLSDKIGRKRVILISILGVAPFSLVLPYCSLGLTVCLSLLIGFIISSAFSSILVYAIELAPNKIGAVSGLFFGFAFGKGGVGSAILGRIADQTSISFLFKICVFLPLIGVAGLFMPDIEMKKNSV